MNKNSFDVIVIGGGAAGLSGALTLARARRSVLVLDSGEPRNAPAEGVHGYLTRDGLSPRDLVELGSAEVTRYGGQVVLARVTGVRPEAPDFGDGPGFLVSSDDGVVRAARRLLVTTGIVDELPDIPGLRERWGRDVLHCPYCHGWEVRDQPIGVVGTGPFAVHQAMLLRQWSDDVTLFLNTAPDPTSDEWEELAARDIGVVDGQVVGVEVDDDRISGVRLASGQLVPRRAVVVMPRLSARAEFLADLGLRTVEHPRGVGTYLETDATGRTSVDGVWAAGNVADPMVQVINAAAAGNNAGAQINMDLVVDDTRKAVALRRMPFSAAEESRNSERVLAGRQHGLPSPGPSVYAQYTSQFWDERYGSATRIWSGNPNPLLVEETKELDPGHALDAGCGEGADAHWLARRGWTVTAVDVSGVALARGAEHAEPAIADRIDWREVDMLTWVPDGSYDLVAAHFLHFPPEVRDPAFTRLAAATAPGGTLLIVGHHPSDLLTTVGRPSQPELFFTAEQIVDLLDPDDWDIEVADARPRPATDPDGNEVTIHDTVLRARKRR
ncbi:SAM-dependent methyltransferase [Pseudonocardia spinosispora]|uniref:SAM-dependent methyltransferase n=1 Tax=Pseudonocardia spinosispora TaxID=103441 RepID=UPI0004220E51|nr:SAM-dependent methyltransferase [Pseudonocardia spinosispora]